jgi:Na+/H+ antiporter NhaC
MVILIGGTIIGMLYAGGCYLCGGTNSFVEAFKQNNATFLVLLISAASALTGSILLALVKKIITLSQIPRILLEGTILMHGPITMVILASILGTFLRIDLQTGHYVAHTLLTNTSIQFIPIILFITALIITLATGSAWGTFSLLIPITAQMLVSYLNLETPVQLNQVTLLLPTLGALLSGATCGDHISPFSETTTMTGLSAGIGSLKHAYSQIFYALPAIIGSCAAFIVSGMLYQSSIAVNLCCSMLTGIIISFGLLSLLNKMWKK